MRLGLTLILVSLLVSCSKFKTPDSHECANHPENSINETKKVCKIKVGENDYCYASLEDEVFPVLCSDYDLIKVN